MRALAVACLSGVLLVTVAAPAVAQRDPFAPRVVEQPAQTEQDGVQPAEAQPAEAQPRQEPPPEPLPVTGGEAAPWLTLAYILVALGAGAIVLARFFGPPARSSRR